ncbi:endonuclease/exonuclease/phosphatase family protein [Nonomuraea recticatena]|uniref:Endonuclease/exonuclease/phosphatase family protein n=2 Tax=Nonomuraea recticatena TaxID=46178 RepID=A0ABN3RFW1_9ACTN
METVGGTIVTPARRRFPVKALAWMAVSPFAVWAAARIGGLERGSLTTQLMTATPYAAAGSLVSLLVAMAARNRPAAAVALVTSAALGFSVLPRAFGTADTATGRPLKVLTVNLLFGRADTGAIMELVRRFDPDVLSTQELTPDAVGRLDAAGLKNLLPHRVLEDEYSAGGSGLYARYPLTRLDNVVPQRGHHMPVGLLALPGGRPVQIVNVHPYPPLGPLVHDWNAALRALPSASADPVRVLAGDFNASLDHAAMRELLGRGYKDAADEVGQGLVPTWPANKRIPPIITIDHVLVDSRVGVREVSVHTVPGTDHRAVFASLTVP